MSEYLFAYGTLQPGLAPEQMASVVGLLRPVAAGSLPGRLYDLGSYPGAIADPLSEHRIHGTIFRLPEDSGILERLDAYEEFLPDCPEASQFLRIRALVQSAGGENLECWLYVYNRSVDGLPLVADGRFRAELRSCTLLSP